MPPKLTEQDLGTLLALVRQEARRCGYGSSFTIFNYRDWPYRLKRLHYLARKLQHIRETEDGTYQPHAGNT